jgi:hypothetical protein
MAYYTNTRTAFPKTGYASIAIDSGAVTLLGSVSTANTVGDVLDILNACVARSLVTGTNRTGHAVSDLN